MYLFTRTGRLGRANLVKSHEWAHDITEKVNQITGLGVQSWETMFSPEVGRLAWTAAAEDLTQLEDMFAKLLVDPGYLALVETGTQYIADPGVDDHIAQIISGEMDPNRNDRYAAVVVSSMIAGGITKGVAAGIEIAERATKLGGLPTSFQVSSSGQYGGCLWVTTAPTLADLQASEQRVNGDPSFLEYVDQVAPSCYNAAATTQTIWRRLD